MKAHLKRYWKNYLLLALVILVIYLLLSGNKPVESHNTRYEELSKKIKLLEDTNKVIAKREAIGIRVIISQDSTIRSLRTTNEVTRRELDKSKTVNRRLALDVKSTQPEDTSLHARKTDSLIAENNNLIWLIDQYVTGYDSLLVVVDQQKVTYEQRITDQVNLNSQMRTVLDEGKTEYTSLKRDYDKVTKQVAREKLKTKAAALIALGAIAYGFFK